MWWEADRVAEFEQWFEGGSAGTRPPASQLEYMREALAHGLTVEEARRLVDALVDEFPTMTRSTVYSWLVDHWRT